MHIRRSDSITSMPFPGIHPAPWSGMYPVLGRHEQVIAQTELRYPEDLTSSTRKKPLFLDDDDDDISEVAEPIRDGDDGQAQPVTTQGSSRRGDAVRMMKARSAKSKAPAPILDDDSDDDVAFRGFGTRRK